MFALAILDEQRLGWLVFDREVIEPKNQQTENGEVTTENQKPETD